MLTIKICYDSGIDRSLIRTMPVSSSWFGLNTLSGNRVSEETRTVLKN